MLYVLYMIVSFSHSCSKKTGVSKVLLTVIKTFRYCVDPIFHSNAVQLLQSCVLEYITCFIPRLFVFCCSYYILNVTQHCDELQTWTVYMGVRLQVYSIIHIILIELS